MALTRIGPNQSVNLTSNVTGTLPVGNGGIGIASGTTDQFLKFTGTTTLASAADNAGSWVKISTVTASSSSSVDFDNLASTYQMYAIMGSQIKPATDSANIIMNLGPGGGTYAANKTSHYWMKYNNEGDSDTQAESSTTYSLGNATGDQVLGYGLSNHGTYGKAGTLIVYLGGVGQGSAYGSFNAQFNYFGSNNYNYTTWVTGQIQAAADSISFAMSSGNIATGKFTLYGISQ